MLYYCNTVGCDERFAIIKIGNLLLVNVYVPCCGTQNRIVLCEEMLAEVSSWCESFAMCQYIIAGDFNCNLDSNDPVAERINQFINMWSLERCDKLIPSDVTYTYINNALNQQSYIDYALVSSDMGVGEFYVLEPSINFSDHLPLIMSCVVTVSDSGSNCLLYTSDAADE